MKYIVKGDEPQSFTFWKNIEDREYNDLINPIKGDVKKSLLIIDPITFDEISLEEAKLFAKYYLNQENYNEFYTTIKYLFGEN